MSVEVVDPSPKRQKKVKKEKKIAPNRCEHYLVNKRRQCAMQRKAGQRFCSEHMAFEEANVDQKTKQERVPCPLDPKHSVWKSDLAFHLKKCNAKPAKTHDPWYSKNFNTSYGEDDVVPDSETTSSDPEHFDKIKALVREYGQKNEPLHEKMGSHPGLNGWLDGKKNQKHILQQSSLISSMKDHNLLSPSAFYVEFGCGKAELSRAVNTCVIHDDKSLSPLYGFGLIDRGSNRLKSDSKIIKDCEELGIKAPKLKRAKIDIEHLNLDKFLESERPENVVAISKHLCGMATDLTLKSLLHSCLLEKGTFQGLLVAMCCRHVCQYSQLLPESRRYLADHGIKDNRDFLALRRIVTWAVCGKKSESGIPEEGNPSTEDNEALGIIARRMIDESRVHAAQKAMPNYNVELFTYTERAVTLENSCICITKR